jgi:hypothetical protein
MPELKINKKILKTLSPIILPPCQEKEIPLELAWV